MSTKQPNKLAEGKPCGQVGALTVGFQEGEECVNGRLGWCAFRHGSK